MPNEIKKKPRFFYGYVIVAAGFAAMALMWGTVLSYGLFVKPMSAEFGWSRGEMSAAYSLTMFFLGLLSTITGRLNDRFGPRVLLTAGGVFLGASLMLMSRIDSLWQLYLLFGFTAAVGISSGFVPLSSTVARWFIRRRGLMTGIVLAGFGVGNLVGPLIMNSLITAQGWRNAYLIAGIATLVSVILVAQLLRRDPLAAGGQPYGQSAADYHQLPAQEARQFSAREATRSRLFWMLFALNFSFGVSQMAVGVHLVPYATDLGISTYLAASILSVMGVLTTVGRIGLASATDRIGSRRTLTIGLVLVSISLIWLPLAGNSWMLFVFAVIFGIGTGGVPALMSPLVAEMFGMKAHGEILGMASFAWGVGSAVGPTMAGYIFDATQSYRIPFIIFAVLGVVTVFLAANLRPARSQVSTRKE